MTYKASRFNVPSSHPGPKGGKPCFGKFVGFVLGMILGHFWGAMIGLAIGHIFIDSSLVFKNKNAATDKQPTGQVKPAVSDLHRQKLLRVWCGMLARMANSDGAVTQDEFAEVNEFFDTVLELSPVDREFATSAFRLAIDAPYTFEYYANDLIAITENDPTINRSVLDVLVRLSLADGSLNDAERETLRKAAKIFNISLADYDSVLKSNSTDFHCFYEVLGCREIDREEVIRERYMALLKDNDPRDVEGKGLPEEFVKYAKKRRDEITRAYEAIAAKRNFSDRGSKR